MAMDRDTIAASKAWPIQEAQKLIKRLNNKTPAKGYALFQTGYGPSGLPHIGTFAEVYRTTLVRHAFSQLCDVPTRLFAFSDDMDGLRKIPDNIPNADKIEAYLGRPLTAIPDPFGTHESYGHHMNARLQAFLNHFGFEFEFKSATDCYKSGMFDGKLRLMLERFEQIRNVVLPELGAERRATYSPLMPISPKTGKVLQVPIEETNSEAGTLIFKDEDGTLTEVPVTGGHCKCQWRADWALRWAALEVDYEMCGKDLIDSVRLAGRICQRLNGRPPESFIYELFLDDEGRKISKSKGNGLSIEEWLRYGTQDSLAYYLFQNPKKARRLYFDVIPRAVDEHQSFIDAYPEQPDDKKLGNPVWHMYQAAPPKTETPISFAMLLNLASVVNADQAGILWGFIERYAPGHTAENSPHLAKLADGAVAYYQDMVKPHKNFRAPDQKERAALAELKDYLMNADPALDGTSLQNEVYEIGKRHEFSNLRDWFKALYQTLLGQDEGPRFGSFAALYGTRETASLIEQALRGETANS